MKAIGSPGVSYTQFSGSTIRFQAPTLLDKSGTVDSPGTSIAADLRLEVTHECFVSAPCSTKRKAH